MTTSSAAASASTGQSRSRGRGAFLRQFITNTSMVGAFAPSSSHLANRMVRGLELEKARAVLEFGPGTGVVTDAILPRLGPKTKFIAIELNDEMVRGFRKRHPTVNLVHDSVEHARRICDSYGVDKADIIISGLPWASFPNALQDRILKAIDQVLAPDGQLITFGYHIGTLLPAGKRFYQKLQSRYSSIEKSPPIWRNLPPAFVYTCRR